MAKPRTPAAAARPPSRRTDQAAFRLHILAVLGDHAGRLEAEDMLVALAERMDDVLLQRDKEPNPQGELRWQTSARAERRSMIDEGLMVVAQPGIWELTEVGRRLSSATRGPAS